MVSVTISTGVSMLPRSSIKRRDVVRMTGIFSVSSFCSRTSRNFDAGIITITVSPFGRNGSLLEMKIGLVGVLFLADGKFYVNTRFFVGGIGTTSLGSRRLSRSRRCPDPPPYGGLRPPAFGAAQRAALQ